LPGNQFTFRTAFEIPVDDHYVNAVVRETRKEEVEDQIDQKPHVADTAPHTLFR
jgi:hypothetical protein